jgi:uridine kinase
MKKITYSLDEWIPKVIESIDALNHDISDPFIVLVAWWTASWKTSRVAEKIHEAFDNSIIISMDNYYRGHTFMDEQKLKGNILNWDQPEALDLELFHKHLSDLKKWKTILAPEYDFQTDPVYEAIEIKSTEVIIVEWLFALDDSLAELWNLNIFVDIWAHGQIMRRIFRDIKRTWEKPQDIMDYFLETVEPMHMKYILPSKKNANIVISNAYNPDKEADNSGVIESNFKIALWKLNLTKFEETIYELWGTFLWKVEHNDRYFNPSDRKLSDTDEVIKIRKLFWNKLLLSYKWPQKKSYIWDERFILRFFIDEESYQLFKTVYSTTIKELHKTRKNYFLWGVLLSVDTFNNWKIFLDCKYEKGQSIWILYELFDILRIDGTKKINDHYLNIV